MNYDLNFEAGYGAMDIKNEVRIANYFIFQNFNKKGKKGKRGMIYLTFKIFFHFQNFWKFAETFVVPKRTSKKLRFS